MRISDSPCGHWKMRRAPPDGPSYRHRVPDYKRVSGAAEFSSRTRRQPKKMHSKRSQGSSVHTLGGSFPHGRPREKASSLSLRCFRFHVNGLFFVLTTLVLGALAQQSDPCLAHTLHSMLVRFSGGEKLEPVRRALREASMERYQIE